MSGNLDPAAGAGGAAATVGGTAAAAVAAAAGAGQATRQAVPGRDRGPAGRAALARFARRSDPAAWLIAAGAFSLYATLSLSRYARLDPGSWDLSLFTEYVKQYAHLQAPIVDIKRANFNLLGDHFTPILALLAPFFRVFPTPATLLIGQALLTAASVLPVCRVTRDNFGLGVSRAVGAAYAMSWGIQAMIYFDFHEVAFAVPLLAFSLSALLQRRPWAALAWALPLVFVKEDQGFTVAAIGVVMLGAAVQARRGRGRLAEAGRARVWAWAGGVLVAWGLAWSALAITVIIPYFNPKHQYVYWRDGGVLGARGSHFSGAGLLSQLALGLDTKLTTLLLLVVPVLFLALRSPLVLIEGPSLVMRFMSTHRPFWTTGFHYSATAMPILFIAAVDGLARLTAARTAGAGQGARAAVAGAPGAGRLPGIGRLTAAGRRLEAAGREAGLLGPRLPRYAAAAMVLVGAGLAVHFPFARLWQARNYAISAHVRAEQAAMRLVPPGVTVETTESMLASLAARDQTSWVVTDGIANPKYVVYDATRTGLHPPPVNLLAWLEFQHPGATYRRIFGSHQVYVFERTSLTVFAKPKPGA